VAEQGNVCAFGFEEIKDPLPKTTTNFEYDGSQGSERKIGTGYSSFFKQLNKLECALQNQDACVLFEKDCKTKYLGKNVVM
jgi:hypothetical protein